MLSVGWEKHKLFPPFLKKKFTTLLNFHPKIAKQGREKRERFPPLHYTIIFIVLLIFHPRIEVL